jgi:hypothetical protein
MNNQIDNIELLKELRDTLPCGDKRTRMSVIISNYMGMEQSLTPPTEEEVCEAYRDFYHIHLDYNDLLNQFEERKGGRAKGKIIARPRGECVEFLHAIHPHLITLIGRFYEGKAHNE